MEQKKPKILLLSDDLRMGSGIATVSRQIVYATANEFEWVQLGAAIKHPESGKPQDISKEVDKLLGIEGSYVRIYPCDGYGDANTLRHLIQVEKPDVIVHFTDPRYWIWLYQIAHEIRELCPIMYLTIWDNVPDPTWNAPYYASCDSLMCISKQTYGIVNRVIESSFGNEFDINGVANDGRRPIFISYCPHGMNRKWYYPITDQTELKEMAEFRKTLLSPLKNGDSEFVLLWVNRNIRRKQPGDVILAYKQFCDKLSPEEAQKCVLVMHTQPVDDNGTDLPAVKRAICPDYKVVFSSGRHDEKHMNFMYNIADLVINIANNEGHGLTTTEALAAGTPISVTVTGGLQDQCGFKLNGKEFTPDDYIEIQSLHNAKAWEDKLEHGEWCIPIWPRTHSLNGSPPTPYIFDDRVDVDEVSDAIYQWYEMGSDERKRRGLVGSDWVTHGYLNQEYMITAFSVEVNNIIGKFEPLPRFQLFEL